MLQKKHKEGTNHLGKGFPKDSKKIHICPGSLKKECKWPKAFQAQVKACESYWGKNRTLWKKIKQFGVARTGGVEAMWRERLIGNDNESMFWG